MKIAKRLRGNQGLTKLEAPTYCSIQNPGGRNDDNTWIALQSDMLSITTIEGSENLHVRAKICMPPIMNPINLPDMGRMNRNWESEERIGYSPGQIQVRKRWPGQ
jgi:hypothetical protein